MTTSTQFNIENDGDDELLVYIEPEGAELRVPPSGAVEVTLRGATHPVAFKHSQAPGGQPALAIWPVDGDFEARLVEVDEAAPTPSRHSAAGLGEDDLDRLERLVAAAQPGPWTSRVEGRDHGSGSDFIQTGQGLARGTDIELTGATVADQDFIAAAREAVPALVSEVRRLRSQLDTMQPRRVMGGLMQDGFWRTVLGLPFSVRQRRLARQRPGMDEQCFVQRIVASGGDEAAARWVRAALADWVRAAGFTPDPDDDLGRVYGIAEEELDEDLVLGVLRHLKLPPPSNAWLATHGSVNTPCQLARLVSAVRRAGDPSQTAR